jgi:hypothetical protein
MLITLEHKARRLRDILFELYPLPLPKVPVTHPSDWRRNLVAMSRTCPTRNLSALLRRPGRTPRYTARSPASSNAHGGDGSVEIVDALRFRSQYAFISWQTKLFRRRCPSLPMRFKGRQREGPGRLCRSCL